MRYGLNAAIIAGVFCLALDEPALIAGGRPQRLPPRSGEMAPPAGLYFEDDVYFHSGKINGGVKPHSDGRRVARNFVSPSWRCRALRGDIVMNAPTQMSGFTPVDTRSINGFEELGDAVQGAQIEVLQLQRGRLRGYLTHMSVGGMPFSVGSFSVGVRTRGVLSNDRVTIGMLTGCTNRVTQWSREMRPADILVIPPGDDHDARFHGGASYAVISLDHAEIASNLGTEQRLGELGVGPKTHFRADSLAVHSSFAACVTLSHVLRIPGRDGTPTPPRSGNDQSLRS